MDHPAHERRSDAQDGRRGNLVTPAGVPVKTVTHVGKTDTGPVLHLPTDVSVPGSSIPPCPGCRWRLVLATIATAVVTLLAPRPLMADAIRLTTGILVKGDIVDVTSDEVRIIPEGRNRPQSYPKSLVTYIELNYLPAHQSGLELLKAGESARAAGFLEEAYHQEQRPWFRKRALGDLLRAYVEAGTYDLALKRLVEAAGDRSVFPDWSDLPIWWNQSPPPTSTLEHARRLANSTLVEGAITGASYLIHGDGNDKQLAIGLLQQYTDDIEPVRRAIARSLLALHGRLNVDPEAFRREIAALPFEIQYGPYLCLARILESRGRRVEAALEYMRVGLLYQDRRHLAIMALKHASELLKQAGYREEATSLYRELVTRYPEAGRDGGNRPGTDAR